MTVQVDGEVRQKEMGFSKKRVKKKAMLKLSL